MTTNVLSRITTIGAAIGLAGAMGSASVAYADNPECSNNTGDGPDVAV